MFRAVPDRKAAAVRLLQRWDDAAGDRQSGAFERVRLVPPSQACRGLAGTMRWTESGNLVERMLAECRIAGLAAIASALGSSPIWCEPWLHVPFAPTSPFKVVVDSNCIVWMQSIVIFQERLGKI